MKRHFDDELQNIKAKLFSMGLLVENAVKDAAESLFQRDTSLAQRVINNDQEINLCEVEIDELGHKLIALYQPTATDLRLVSVVLKMTSDLERMGDQAVNIAEKALIINQAAPIKPYQDLPRMAEITQEMIREALSAFMERNAVKAKAILKKDDLVDEINSEIYDEVQQLMMDDGRNIKTGIGLIMVSHNFERLADLATNIAEDIIYLEQGIDIRHHIRNPNDS